MCYDSDIASHPEIYIYWKDIHGKERTTCIYGAGDQESNFVGPQEVYLNVAEILLNLFERPDEVFRIDIKSNSAPVASDNLRYAEINIDQIGFYKFKSVKTR